MNYNIDRVYKHIMSPVLLVCVCHTLYSVHCTIGVCVSHSIQCALYFCCVCVSHSIQCALYYWCVCITLYTVCPVLLVCVSHFTYNMLCAYRKICLYCTLNYTTWDHPELHTVPCLNNTYT